MYRYCQHARARARERYSVDLTDAVAKEMSAEIISGRATLLDRQRSGCSIYLIEWRTQPMPIVWDRAAGIVVTILPWNAVHRYDRAVRAFFDRRQKEYEKSNHKRKFWHGRNRGVRERRLSKRRNKGREDEDE